MSDIAKRLRALEELRTSGTITETEYHDKREAILDRLTQIDPNAGRVSAIVRAILIAALILAFVYAAAAVSCVVIFDVVGVVVGGTSMGAIESQYEEGSSSGQINNESVGTQVTINSIKDPALPSSSDGVPPSGKRYVAIDVTAEDTGHVDLKALNVRLHTWDGNEYSPKKLDQIGATDGSFLKNISVGATAQGSLGFELPAGQSVEWLRFRSDPSGVEVLFRADQ